MPAATIRWRAISHARSARARPRSGSGFAPVESGEGTLISFSTQPGNVALDGTGRNSPYAAALLKHIATPGDDLPTILINVRNDVMQATERRQVPWEHSAMTAKFYFIAAQGRRAQQIELAFWTSVKDSTNPAVLGHVSRAVSDRRVRAGRARAHRALRQPAQAGAGGTGRGAQAARRSNEGREAKRLEDEQRAREAALADERKRAKETKNSQEAARADKERAELLARNEELRKALDEVRIAREAAKAAEEQRLAALKAAEDATKAAEETIAKKRAAEKTSDPAKVAALPKLETSKQANSFDGTWQMVRAGQQCANNNYTPLIFIKNGIVSGRLGGGAARGSVSASGAFQLTHSSSSAPGTSHSYSGTLRGNAGSGTFSNNRSNCRGTFTLTRR